MCPEPRTPRVSGRGARCLPLSLGHSRRAVILPCAFLSSPPHGVRVPPVGGLRRRAEPLPGSPLGLTARDSRRRRRQGQRRRCRKSVATASVLGGPGHWYNRTCWGLRTSMEAVEVLRYCGASMGKRLAGAPGCWALAACVPAARPQGHAGLAGGARLVGCLARSRVGARSAAGQGARPRGLAAASALLPGLPGGALVAAPGCARPAAAWGQPAGPLLGRGEGSPRAHSGKGRRHRGPGRPVGPGERRQPGTYRGGGGGATLGRGRLLRRGSVPDANNVPWPVRSDASVSELLKRSPKRSYGQIIRSGWVSGVPAASSFCLGGQVRTLFFPSIRTGSWTRLWILHW